VTAAATGTYGSEKAKIKGIKIRIPEGNKSCKSISENPQN
jgi:hypothetical protein